MTPMLRYVRYIKRLNEVGWKVAVNQQVSITGRKFIFQNNQNLLKSYTTAATQSKLSVDTNISKFHQFEDNVKRYGKIFKSNIRDLIDEIEKKGNVSSLDGLFLINSCGRALINSSSQESIKLVQEIWNTLESLQTPIDVSHFNALLSVYLENAYDFSPVNFLKFMEEKGIQPNRVTYQRLIRRYCQTGNIAGATNMLEIMKEKGMPLNEDVFNSLILGHSEANDIESALKILDVMKKAGIFPSADTYAELMCAYAKQGDLESILKTLSEVPKDDIVFEDIHYLNIFYTLVINEHKEQAETFLKNVSPEIHLDLEIVRCLNKLIFANHIDLALKLLTNTSKNLARQKIRATVFMKSMISNNVPVEKVIELCQYFNKNFQYNLMFQGALYQVFVHNPKLEYAFPLMKAWQEMGEQLKEHYFWPLLVAEAKNANMNCVQDIFKSMIEDFKIIPTEVTIKNYILPYMFGTWNNIIVFFEQLNIPTNIICNAIADRLLIDRKLKNCTKFVVSNPSLYSKNILLHHLAEALNIKRDVQSFTLILRFISDNSEQADPNKTPISLVDEALRNVMDVIPQFRKSIVMELTNEFLNSGLSISPEVAAEVKSYLGTECTNDIEENLQKLSSGTLTIVPIDIYCSKSMEFSENILLNKKKILDLRENIFHHMKERNFEKAYDIVKSLHAAGYKDIGFYAHVIRIFCNNNYLIGAESCINFLKTYDPNAKLDLKKCIQYASLLIKNNRFNDAIEFLKSERDANESEAKSKEILSEIRSILENSASRQNVENLNELFNLLHSKNYLHPDNNSLGPLVKIHMLRGDNDKALEVFEKACCDYKCAPYKNKLIKTFIENEDANSLQKITDLNAELVGEMNALTDLAFCFVEFGQLKQAQKIFSTPGFVLRNEKILYFIEHYNNMDHTDALNKLIVATKPVKRMDRSFLYDNILKLHYEKNDWNSGLNLWTDMQEENIQPSEYFLNTLGSLLQKNNQSTPFVVTSPKTQKLNKNEFKDDADYEDVEQKNENDIDNLIKSTNLTKSISILKYNNLIMSLLECCELNRAYAIANTLLSKYGVISRNVFNELSSQLIEARRHEDVRKLVELLSMNNKNHINYWKVIKHIEIIEKGLKYFMENLQPSDENKLKNNFIPFEMIVQSLISNPKDLNEYEAWARNWLNLGIQQPMQILWNYYFITNDERETQFFDEYLSGRERLLVKPIIKTAIKKKDPDLIEKLIVKLDQAKYLNPKIKKSVHSNLIELYLSLNRPEDALTVLYKYLKNFSMDSISNKILIQLRNKYEISGKKFPLIIKSPEKSTIEINNEEENESLTQAKI